MERCRLLEDNAQRSMRKMHSEKNSVFVRLVDSGGSFEDEIVGSLYIEETEDEAGIIKEVHIEAYGRDVVDDLVDHFEDLDWDEDPAIPGIFAVTNGGFYVRGVYPDDGDNVELQEEGDIDTVAGKANTRYISCYQRALRVVERVRRGDPVLCGYKDRQLHGREWSSQDDEKF